jgi:hypothetical protein
MIVEYVQFKYPAGWTREQILEDARPTAVKWRANKELIRKHYIAGENGAGGAFYITYFDLMMIVDNEAGTTTEFPPTVAAEAAE